MDFGTYKPFNEDPPSGHGHSHGNDIEDPIIPVSEIGATIPEGSRFGNFVQTATAHIRAGAGQLELQTNMGGGPEAVGAESYGKQARETLREIARANDVVLTSIHTPVNIGNMSGFNPQQGNFNDEHRKVELDEVKKAIRFAAEVSQGGAVVVHTGEFNRPIFDADWNKKGKWAGQFIGYDEEADRAVKPLVDNRTGRVISEVRMNQLVPRAVWQRAKKDYKQEISRDMEFDGVKYKRGQMVKIKEGQYVDYEGNPVDRKNRLPEFDVDKNEFKIRRETWKDFEEDAHELNEIEARKKSKEEGRKITVEDLKKYYPEDYVSPEEAFMYATTETQESIARGWASNYGLQTDKRVKELERLKNALKHYEQLDKNIPESERWKLIQKSEGSLGNLVPGENQTAAEIIQDQIAHIRDDLQARKDMVTGQLQHAEEQKILREHAVSARKYALNKSFDSYAQAGIYAMDESQNNPYVKRDVFVAPENLWPEMGFGTHPDELIELVKGSRKRMAKMLQEKRSMSKKAAEEYAERHIKSTFDTQHLGMWIKHFKAKDGESEENRIKRFNVWFSEKSRELADSGIVGNVHLVDGYGGGHHHLPAGEGIFPTIEAVKYLKKKGYKHYINSEAHGEEGFGQKRILVQTWKNFGFTTPIERTGFAVGGGGPAAGGRASWGNIAHGYFGNTYAPQFIFGAYAPSNDWTLWSQVPME